MGQFMILRFADGFLDRPKVFGVCFGSQDVATVGGHALEDFGYLLRALPIGKNDLRHARAQPPVVVHFGEAQVFKGHVPQTGNSFVRTKSAFFYLLQ
jgi:hypothetical protein